MDNFELKPFDILNKDIDLQHLLIIKFFCIKYIIYILISLFTFGLIKINKKFIFLKAQTTANTQKRQVKVLNGIWKFKREERMNQGTEEKWFENPLTDTIEMPVPSSYNDITTDKAVRDHVGWVWYEKEFYIPSDWQKKRMVLRFP